MLPYISGLIATGLHHLLSSLWDRVSKDQHEGIACSTVNFYIMAIDIFTELNICIHIHLAHQIEKDGGEIKYRWLQSS